MKKFILLTSIFVLALNCTPKTSSNAPEGKVSIQSSDHSIYEYTVQDIYGEPFPMGELNGKKVMIVNTASKCGLTPQYKKLEELYQKYVNQNFIIVGFPSNDFNNQEPGSNEDIIKFCQANYGVSFPMMAKVHVKDPDMAPIYQYLTEYDLNGLENNEVQWNFQKYLIDENGHLDKVVSPKIEPDDIEIINWIEGN